MCSSTVEYRCQPTRLLEKIQSLFQKGREVQITGYIVGWNEDTYTWIVDVCSLDWCFYSCTQVSVCCTGHWRQLDVRFWISLFSFSRVGHCVKCSNTVWQESKQDVSLLFCSTSLPLWPIILSVSIVLYRVLKWSKTFYLLLKPQVK